MYSFFLPIYSFWCMDDFSWGNTRLVIGEGSNKKVIMNDDEKFDDSMIPLKKFSGKDSLCKNLRGISDASFQSTRLRPGRLRHGIPMKLGMTAEPIHSPDLGRMEVHQGQSPHAASTRHLKQVIIIATLT